MSHVFLVFTLAAGRLGKQKAAGPAPENIFCLTVAGISYLSKRKEAEFPLAHVPSQSPAASTANKREKCRWTEDRASLSRDEMFFWLHGIARPSSHASSDRLLFILPRESSNTKIIVLSCWLIAHLPFCC